MNEDKENAARMDISFRTIAEMLDLPFNTTIKRITQRPDKPDTVSIIVENPDLPEVFWGMYYPIVTPTYRTDRWGRLIFINWGDPKWEPPEQQEAQAQTD